MDIMTFIQWINQNEGFLMVLTTIIYVIATIVICVLNHNSNKFSREQFQKQLEESRKQQFQNAGIQLYGLRKKIIKQFTNKEFNEIFFDIPLLFNTEISDDFFNLTDHYTQLENLLNKMKEFELHLKNDIGKEYFDEFKELEHVSNLPNADDKVQENLYKFCDDYIYTRKDEVTNESIKYDYREMSESAKKLSLNNKAEYTKLFLKMQKFVKTSITK